MRSVSVAVPAELRRLERSDHDHVELAAPGRHVARGHLAQRPLVEDRVVHLDAGLLGEQRGREVRDVLHLRVVDDRDVDRAAARRRPRRRRRPRSPRAPARRAAPRSTQSARYLSWSPPPAWSRATESSGHDLYRWIVWDVKANIGCFEHETDLWHLELPLLIVSATWAGHRLSPSVRPVSPRSRAAGSPFPTYDRARLRPGHRARGSRRLSPRAPRGVRPRARVARRAAGGSSAWACSPGTPRWPPPSAARTACTR